MKPFSPITILTAVILTLVSPMGAFGADTPLTTPADCDRNAIEAEIESLDNLISAANTRLSAMSDAEKKADNGKIAAEIRDHQSKKTRFTTRQKKCDKDEGDRKEDCKAWKTKYEEAKKDFGPALQAVARECTGAFEDNDGNGSEAILAAMTGMVPDGNPKCELGAAKTQNKDKRNDISKDIDKLEDGVIKADKDLEKANESVEKQLIANEKERRELKDEYDKAKKEAEVAQIKALRQLRDAQAAKGAEIRQLNTAAIAARQQIANVEAKLKYALSFAKPLGNDKATVNLRSETSILNYCKAEARKSVGTGLSKDGASRAQQARDQIMTCIEGLREQRVNTAKASEQELEMRADQLKGIYEQIDSATKALAQLTENYNEDVKRLSQDMTDAQKRFFEADNAKATEYNNILQRGQQAQSRMQMEKLQKQQKIISKYRTQGRLTEDDVDEINAKATEIADLERNLTGDGVPGNACNGFGKNFKPISDQVAEALKTREQRKAQE